MCYFQAIDLTKKLRRFQLKDFAHQNQVIRNNMKTNSVLIDFEKYRQVNVLIMEISNSLLIESLRRVSLALISSLFQRYYYTISSSHVTKQITCLTSSLLWFDSLLGQRWRISSFFSNFKRQRKRELLSRICVIGCTTAGIISPSTSFVLLF